MFDTLNDPQRLHAVMTHLPLGAAAIGLLLALAVAVTGGRVRGLRWAAAMVYLLAMAACFVTVATGERAADAMTDAGVLLAGPVHDTLHDHEELAEKAWMFFGATGLFLLLMELKVLRVAGLVLALLLALGTAGWTAWVGHLGGELVYRYGVGVPATAYNKPATGTAAQTSPSTQPVLEDGP